MFKRAVFLITSFIILVIPQSIQLIFTLYIMWYNKILFFHANLCGLIYGIISGLVLSIIGYFMLAKVKAWNISVSYVVSNLLNRDIKATLFITLIYVVFEEIIARGPILSILTVKHDHIHVATLVPICIIVNLTWTIGHILNNFNDLKKSIIKTVRKSLFHLLTIFLSGIIFSILAIVFKSLTPAIAAHYTLNLSFAILYKKYISQQKVKCSMSQ